MIGPIAGWLAALMVIASALGPTLAAAAEQQAAQAPPAQAPKPKKPPTSKLIQPWPDAAKLAERRADAESRPLFQQSDPLVFTLAADFKAVTQDRDVSSTKTFPALLTVENPPGAGKVAPLPVSLRTRGNLRLKPRICSFMPLAIEFPKKEAGGTVFESQGALKLVTHCQDNAQYEQYLLREYLAYRLYNLITPRSFRVRLARVTYVDAASGGTLTTRYAVLIEDVDELAARLEARAIALPRMQFADFDQDALTLMMIFQFMIGNTDFSIYSLHNVQQVMTPAKVFYPIIWDFDVTGLVNPPYSVPDPKLGISSPRKRVYRGPCRTMAELEPSLAVFRAKKAEALALFDLPSLDQRNRREAAEFLAEFFSLLGRPDALKRDLANTCRSQPTM